MAGLKIYKITNMYCHAEGLIFINRNYRVDKFKWIKLLRLFINFLCPVCVI